MIHRKPSVETDAEKEVEAGKDATKVKKVRGKKPIPLLDGFRNVLPQEEIYWSAIRSRFETLAHDYDFQWIALPIVEPATLFHRSGSSPFIFEDEDLVVFEDAKKNRVVLRPDATAQLGRAYVEHGMSNLPQPVKFYYEGPFFHRHPVWGGRLTQFHGAGFMSIGDVHPVLDAEMILLSLSLFEELGLPVSIQINSLGCPECRPIYLQQLREYYRTRKKFLCEDCKIRVSKAPLDLMTCDHVDCHELSQDAPQFIDHLCEACRAHFVSVLEHLDESEVAYVLNPKITRGSEFYSRTVFEIWVEATEYQGPLVIAIGGRHDYLIENLGGELTPSVSSAFGMERVVQVLKERGIKPKQTIQKDVFLAQLGDSAKKKSLKLFNDLRSQGMRVSAALSKDGLREQLGTAVKFGVKFTIIIGQKEIIDETALLRDMVDGSQEVIDFKKIVSTIQKRLNARKPETDRKPSNGPSSNPRCGEQARPASKETPVATSEPSGRQDRETFSIGSHNSDNPPDEVFSEQEDPFAIEGNSEKSGQGPEEGEAPLYLKDDEES